MLSTNYVQRVLGPSVRADLYNRGADILLGDDDGDGDDRDAENLSKLN